MMRRHHYRRPLLRARMAAGGAGLLAVAIAVGVGYMSSTAAQHKARAEAIIQTQAQLAKPHVAGEIIVGYRDNVSDKTKQVHIDHHGGRLKQRLPRLGTDVVTVAAGDEASTLADLKTDPDVTFAEPDYKRSFRGTVMTPTDPAYSLQWGYPAAAFDQVWPTTVGAGAPLIAQLDSGVDLTHPDLAGHIAPGGTNIISNNSDPTDDNGHGTATAGIIIEAANNGIGGAGGCWDCKILPVKVLDAQGNGDVAGIAAGITYAVDHGAKIINASFGGPDASTVEANAVAYAISKGVIYVGAACEDLATNPVADYPSSYPGVIGVGALNRSGNLESWSCHGPFVKLAAPSSSYTTSIHSNYATFTGTSAAAPFVSAAAALLWSAYPLATADQVRNALLAGADACCSSQAGGKLDVAKALSLLASSLASPTPSATPAPAKKGDANHDGHINVFDLSYLLGKWGTADPTADLNGDGTVNVFDLSALLSEWSP